MSVTSGRGPDLDDVTRAAYQHAVSTGRFQREDITARLHLTTDEALRIERTLRSLCLLHPLAAGSHLVPVSPDAAAVALVASTERHIHDLQHSVTAARARLLSLMPRYLEGRHTRTQHDAVDVIADPDTAQLMIDQATDQATNEILTMRPGPPLPPHRLAADHHNALHTLRRHITLRTLYQHTARTDPPTTTHLNELTTHGAHIRTTSEITDHITIYDRTTAFLHNPTHTLTLIREPTLLTLLTNTFHHHWDNATPYHPPTHTTSHTHTSGSLDNSHTSGSGSNTGAHTGTGTSTSTSTDINTDIKHTIIRLMAQGHKDEVIARRLGMSLRTCRRRIAEIMTQLNATSRFQTGVNATRTGLLNPPPP
ncbi:hypothetical protein QFZ75_008267, partial [Streptomyces sp. V3I8]|uniref:helix-turn-helix domain-containing protein n=1 Tax=Streptomyces sp. V3I8 TaxID=3042279 RepID=UPI00278205F5